MLIYKKPQRAIISDINEDIINVYKMIRLYPNELIKELEFHDKHDTEDHYYATRNEFNDAKKKREQMKMEQNECLNENMGIVQQAGRFIYLNARCFNGLYRENASGEMNSPYAKDLKGMKRISNPENIIALSKYFNDADIFIQSRSYETIFNVIEYFIKSKIKIVDDTKIFFFLDPPYYPISETASFTSYSKDSWRDPDFIKLRIFVDEINKNCWKFLLCNHSVPFIKSLFKGYYQVEHLVSRSVSCNAQDRKPVTEILIANYEITTTNQTKVI